MSEAVEKGEAENTRFRLREYVYQQFPLARKLKPSDDSSLLESGIVDSLGILEIVNFVTGEFAVEISDEDLLPENFDSIEALARFVIARKG